MKLPWPEQPTAHLPDLTVRHVLDYICWITQDLQREARYAGADAHLWRKRIHEAYVALFVPAVPGHGDPYPPDVPPARNPGVWPDVPALTVTGMTVRHQLKVIGMLAEQIRDRSWIASRAEQLADWDARICRVHQALDHGEAHPMPEEARTEASPELLAAAAAQERALRDHARRRTQRLRKIRRRTQTRAKKKAPAKGKAAPRKAAKSKPSAKKKARKAAAKVRKKPAAKKKKAKKAAAKTRKKPAAKKKKKKASSGRRKSGKAGGKTSRSRR